VENTINRFVQSGSLVEPDVETRKGREAELAALGIEGPAAELILRREAHNRQVSRSDAAAAAALLHLQGAWGQDDGVPTREWTRRDYLVAAAALCAIEARVATGRLHGQPCAGLRTIRQPWAQTLGSGRKHALDGGAWDDAFEWAALRLLNAAGAPASLPETLEPLVGDRPPVSYGECDEAHIRPCDRGGVCIAWKHGAVLGVLPLVPEWVAAVADKALRNALRRGDNETAAGWAAVYNAAAEDYTKEATTMITVPQAVQAATENRTGPLPVPEDEIREVAEKVLAEHPHLDRAEVAAEVRAWADACQDEAEDFDLPCAD